MKGKLASPKKPLNFKVRGPFRLSVSKQRFGRCIGNDAIGQFWSDRHVLAEQKGCYVFCMSKRPFYVGKATKSFRQEVFNPKNLNTYQSVLSSVQGIPSLYLITLSHKGKTPISVISQVEKLLIGMAHEANPSLKNVHHRNREDRFLIGGVYNSGKGKRSKSANALRTVLRLVK